MKTVRKFISIRYFDHKTETLKAAGILNLNFRASGSSWMKVTKLTTRTVEEYQEHHRRPDKVQLVQKYEVGSAERQRREVLI